MTDFLKEKCEIKGCGASMENGSTMCFHKGSPTTCHMHQNRGKDTQPGSLTCGFDCHYLKPYGFVPEAGCPVHDKE